MAGLGTLITTGVAAWSDAGQATRPPPKAPLPDLSLPTPPPVRAPAAEQTEWRAFKARFIDGGRVVDTGNAGISHSEGQGTGMLLAVAFDDRDMFEMLWRWTRTTLGRPADALHAWRYQPGPTRGNVDWSNATDGDILIAAALGRAWRQWNEAAHATAALAIAGAILGELVRPAGTRTVLLPGLRGFEQRDTTIVNLSYYAYPLLLELAALLPSPRWLTLIDDGLALTERAGFGRWRLPPDWLAVDTRSGAIAPAPGWPARFAYDAVRIPLWLAWGGFLSAPLSTRFAAFWRSEAGVTAWIDLRSGQSASFPANPGMRAISALVTGGDLAPSIAHVAAAPDYYAAGLLLLARMATRENPSMT